MSKDVVLLVTLCACNCNVNVITNSMEQNPFNPCNSLSLGGRHEWTDITSEWEESWGHESKVNERFKRIKS